MKREEISEWEIYQYAREFLDRSSEGGRARVFAKGAQIDAAIDMASRVYGCAHWERALRLARLEMEGAACKALNESCAP